MELECKRGREIPSELSMYGFKKKEAAIVAQSGSSTFEEITPERRTIAVGEYQKVDCSIVTRKDER